MHHPGSGKRDDDEQHRLHPRGNLRNVSMRNEKELVVSPVGVDVVQLIEHEHAAHQECQQRRHRQRRQQSYRVTILPDMIVKKLQSVIAVYEIACGKNCPYWKKQRWAQDKNIIKESRKPLHPAFFRTVTSS